MTSLRVPMTSSSRSDRKSSVNRSSAVMSALLELDRALGTVGYRQASVACLARRHRPVAEDRPVALVVLAEQVGGEVVAAAVPLAALRVDVHSHRSAPVCRSGVTSIGFVTGRGENHPIPRVDRTAATGNRGDGQLLERLRGMS